jgi:signal transduction histidine kinase
VTVLLSAAGSVALIAMGSHYPITMGAFLGSLFAFALASDRRHTMAVAVPVKLGLLTAALIAGAGIASLVVVLWAALATSLGNAVRNHRGYLAEVTERARRAERDAEDQARRRVAEERMRIARELHDVIGHHVALISVQAGAMGYLLDNDLAKARESLAHIQRASEAALEELRLTVGLVRQPGDHEPVDAVGELIASFAATGLRVTCDMTGQVRQLPAAVDLTAYRLAAVSGSTSPRAGPGPTTSPLRPPACRPSRPADNREQSLRQGHAGAGAEWRVAAQASGIVHGAYRTGNVALGADGCGSGGL